MTPVDTERIVREAVAAALNTYKAGGTERVVVNKMGPAQPKTTTKTRPVVDQTAAQAASNLTTARTRPVTRAEIEQFS